MAKLTCKVCGTEYSYCPHCPADKDKPKWMSTFCEENCKEIFDTLVSHTVHKISDVEARDKLKRLDLSKRETFDPDIRDYLEDILKQRKKKS